ncbi:MAG: lpdA1 [Chlamydiia bacterium]|nr:lpdA1 [Chlamydiia bacterium]
MNEKKYDVAILGGGPGGYPAAIKLAQSGKKVALIEAKAVGGTCLNRGCIPTKTLIANADILHTIRKAKEFGIDVKEVSVDFTKMAEQKDTTVTKLKASLEGLIVSNGIDIIRGFGKFVSPNELKVMGQDNLLIKADAIIIATGTEPKEIAAFAFDGKFIHSSTTILELQTLPKSIAIVGGGVIGCEFASLYAELGVTVTVIEALPRLIPLECETLSAFLAKSFQKRGLNVMTGAMVSSIQKNSQGISIQLKDGKTVDADCALVAIGRSCNTIGIGLEQAGIAVDKAGMIAIDEHMRTAVPGIYAIGDITGKAMYAHVATHQGIVAAEDILGHTLHMNYDAVPGVIFTSPEIASVGMSLATALQRGYQATRTTYPFQALGKAQAAKQTDGFAQIVIDETTGQILGAQVAGHEASNLIAPMVTVIANELTIGCIPETIHAHPTMQEVWMESALIAQGIPLHYPPIKKRG